MATGAIGGEQRETVGLLHMAVSSNVDGVCRPRGYNNLSQETATGIDDEAEAAVHCRVNAVASGDEPAVRDIPRWDSRSSDKTMRPTMPSSMSPDPVGEASNPQPPAATHNSTTPTEFCTT